jgi:hypothetical protein
MAVIKYKQKGRIGLFDNEEISAKLSKLGNPLKKIRKIVDFELFRPELEANMLNQNKKSNVGSKPFDVVMMFKIVLLKRFYQLSDKKVEYQIHDRFSFREFLGLASGDRIPKANTIRTFQQKMMQKHLEEKLLEQVYTMLVEAGLFVKEGQLVDANLVKVTLRKPKTLLENEK